MGILSSLPTELHFLIFRLYDAQVRLEDAGAGTEVQGRKIVIDGVKLNLQSIGKNG